MDLDEDFGEVEDLETSSDENARYLRVSYPGRGGFRGGFPGGFPGSSPDGGSSSGQQLKVPLKPRMRGMPRKQAPKGWDKAKKKGKQYKGFYLHHWCDCQWGSNWFCFCFDFD
jgi:hypothetical protein